jgi:hypothetical protein
LLIVSLNGVLFVEVAGRGLQGLRSRRQTYVVNALAQNALLSGDQVARSHAIFEPEDGYFSAKMLKIGVLPK